MRFRKIEIPAYGPFTEFEKNLPSDTSDFHIFYGPNEAGKSSLLRSLRDFLFGIPARSSDNFLHDYRDMRIVAELENNTGNRAIFQRRKGQKSTLLDAAGSALPDSALAGFLGGVDAAYFDNMFGLDFEKLREGAEELLRGEGRLGEALFSASLGGTPVDKVLKSLEAEAAELFKGRAKSSIRVAKRELDEFQKSAREAITRPEAWEEIEASLTENNTARLALENLLRDLAARRDWLRRCSEQIEIIGRHADQSLLLSQLPEIPDLEENFPERAREARRNWQAARETIDSLKKQIETLTQQAGGISPDTAVLAAASSIKNLTADLGTYGERTKNLGKISAETAALADQINRQAADLNLPSDLVALESHRISKVALLETTQAAEALALTRSENAQAKLSATSLEKEIARLEAQRTPADPNAIASLETALSGTSSAGELVTSLTARIAKTAALFSELGALHHRLTGSPADLSSTASLRLPLKSSLEKFREILAESSRDKKSTTAELAAANAEIATLKSEIELLTATGDIPSPAQLNDARAHRENGWQAVLKAWKNGETTRNFVSEKTLEIAYPEAVTAADHIADNLRNHAETVARIEEKKARLRTAENRAAKAEQQLKSVEKSASENSAEWKKLLATAALPDFTPAEMMEWRDIWESFSRSFLQWRAESEKIEQDKSRIKEAADQLRAALPASPEGADLESLLETARAEIDAHHQAVGAEKSLTAQIAAKQRELSQCKSAFPDLEAALSKTEDTWSSCREKFSFPESLSPENVLDLLRSRNELFATLDRFQELQRQTTELSKSTSEYEAKVAKLSRSLALKTADTAAAISALGESLTAAESQRSQLENHKSLLAEKQSALLEAETSASRNLHFLDDFLTAARLPGIDQLEPFLHRLAEKSRITTELRSLRQALAGAARGESVEDFISKVRAEKPELLDSEIAENQAETARFTAEKEAIESKIRELSAARAAMENASDDAAAHIQQAELASGRIREDGERFVRLQLAISILRNRIEVFREQNQGPFMEKAGHWFSKITGGAFSGITTSFDSGDTPIIAALRADGRKPLPVEGMSEGTRDQLFLALRLAGLEIHADSHEPMPLILDDLLVHFDDERSANALNALAGFGKKSQVLLFTHHAHLMELATNTLGKTGFHAHRL